MSVFYGTIYITVRAVLAAGDYSSAVCVHPPYKVTPQAAFRRRNKVAFAKKMLRKLAFFPHTMEKVLTSSFALSKKLDFSIIPQKRMPTPEFRTPQKAHLSVICRRTK